MKGEGFLRDPFFIITDAIFINTDAIKVPTYGTIVPCVGHNSAFQEAICTAMGSNMSNLAFSNREMELISLFNFRWVQKLEQFIARHQLLDKDKPCLIALSGGADSVSLLLALLHLGYKTEACHCNFHLRGSESVRDEQFCVSLCERLGVPLIRLMRSVSTLSSR